VDVEPARRAIVLRMRDGSDRAMLSAQEARQITEQLVNAARLDGAPGGVGGPGARLAP
jgi:hypothetical protein